MLATNHALSGALIGAYLPLPLAVPVAFASHFVLDTLPHYGIPHNQRNQSLRYKLIVFLDTFVALSCAAVAGVLGKWHMEITGWTAYAPDALWVWYYFRNNKTLQIEPDNQFMKFHQRIQRYERPWGIIIDLLFMAALFPVFIYQLTQ